MATDLTDLVPALQRAVAVPGTFETVFPESTNDDLAMTLLDGFAEAQLDGFFVSYISNDDGIVAQDMSRAEQALVVIYASTRVLMSEIRNRKTHKRYEAGSVTFEEDQSASSLVELLKQMKERKKELRSQGIGGNSQRAFFMADQYLARGAGVPSWI